MKRNIIKFIVLVTWFCLFMVLNEKGILTTDTAKIRNTLGNNLIIMICTFVLLSIGRVLFFIPGVVFMCLGGLCFGPVVGFILSMISIIISETVIYMIGRYFASERLNRYLNNSHKNLVLLTDQHGYEFLALGILCPIAPSDLVCMISAILNFNYRKYILTVIFANAPMMLVYSYLGSCHMQSTDDNAILAVIFGVILIYTILIWLKTKRSVANT